MAAFEFDVWMSVLPIVHPPEPLTSPLKGLFNTPSKIEAAIHALSKLCMNEKKSWAKKD
jgi:hypothetical protein